MVCPCLVGSGAGRVSSEWEAVIESSIFGPDMELGFCGEELMDEGGEGSLIL